MYYSESGLPEVSLIIPSLKKVLNQFIFENVTNKRFRTKRCNETADKSKEHPMIDAIQVKRQI